MKQYLLTLPPKDIDLIRADASLGHRITMGVFGDIFDRKSPRAHAKILWKLQNDGILIQSAIPPESDRVKFVKDVSVPTQGQKITLTYDTTLLKTKTISVPQQLWDSGYRPKAVPKIVVPEEEREQRAQQLLERNGFQVNTITISQVKYLTVGRGTNSFNQPYFSIICQGIVTEPDSFTKFLFSGTGKCKNYGIGLVIAT